MNQYSVPLRTPLFRGTRRLRVALVGMPNAGKSTLFGAVSSAAPRTGKLAGTQRDYAECTVQAGFDEASVVELPSIVSLHHLAQDDLAALKYILWGDERPPVSAHEPAGPPAPLAASGAAGIGEVRVADPAAIEVSAPGGLPMLVHCSEEVGHAYGGKAGGLTPAALWRLLEAQPHARVIAAHWGGGFPFYALMPEVRAIIDAGRLVFDTAASPLLYAPEAVRRGIDLAGMAAVCWGSDFPLRDQAQDRAAIEAVLPPGLERDSVLGGNATRFLALAQA